MHAARARQPGLLLAIVGLLASLLFPAPTLSQETELPLTSEAAEVRKAAVQAELEGLAQAGLSEEQEQEARDQLGRLLAALTSFGEAVRRRDTHRARLENLQPRLEEVEGVRKELEETRPPVLSEFTESLLEEYESRRRELESELDDLAAQETSGGVRLARLPEEIQQLKASLERLERQASDTSPEVAGASVLAAELLDVQIQEHRVSIEALETERLWLIERGPLQDARVRVARLRLRRVREQLGELQASMGSTFRQQYRAAGVEIERLQQALHTSTSPAARVHLQARLETAVLGQRTVDYQRQLDGIRQQMHAQETRNKQITQDAGRLVSLAEQYGSGEGIAQRLLIKFEYLRRERRRLASELVDTLHSPLQALLPAEKAAASLDALKFRLADLNEILFAVDEQIYELDGLTRGQANRLTAALFSASPSELAGALSTLHDAMEARRSALREQQQVLVDLTQTLARLIALNQDEKRLLDEGYRLALSKMLWLKNEPVLSLGAVGEAAPQALSLVFRYAAAIRSDLFDLWSRLKRSIPAWGLLILLLVVLPAAARRCWLYLGTATRASLGASVRQGEPPHLRTALLIMLRAAIWPGYLVLLLSSRQFFGLQHDDAGMTAGLASGGYFAAAVLGVGLFTWKLFRPDGWGRHFWQLEEGACNQLRHTFGIGCLAGLVFLVPRQVVLATTADPMLAGGGQVSERLLLLVFQGVVFVLALRLGRQGGPLMAQVLRHSREQEGLLRHVWPFLQAMVLAALAGVMALDILGYRYTAQFIWLNGLETLSIILGSRLLLLFLLMYVARRFVSTLFEPGRRWHDPARRQAAERSLAVFRFVSQLVLWVLGVLLILELWGVSVWRLLSSDLGSQVLTRGFIVFITIAVVLLVIQGSNVLAEYILRPRLTSAGESHESGRKLRTLTPLVQTILKVVVLFIAVLVLLEQVNIRTGPLLAGLGLFGLAIGLASQSLIKDIINGLFILFEDSLSVGDVVTVRGISGVVEKITLRVVVLRDLEGNVHVVPNSTIDLVTNMTKVFSRYLLDVGVAYREDVDTVIGILKEIDEQMRRDPAYGFNMLEPIEILGLDRFGDSAVYIRARLVTRPKKQWEVGREFNRRMKKVFDERGIEIPFPHRTVYWGIPKTGSQPAVQLSMNNRES